MSNRSERRESERLQRKLAFQQSRAQAAVSEAQLAANRANAQLSTGPVTSEGREISSRNALKTGLTGRTVLLPTDDASEYNRRFENAAARYRPVTEDEMALVQSIVDTDWRLNRIVTLETGIYVKGLTEFADKFNDQPAAHRNTLIQTETHLKYEKSLRNLHIQEARLQRQRTKHIAELKRLQEDRRRQEAARPATSANGFEFATDICQSSATLASARVGEASVAELTDPQPNYHY